LGLSIICPQGLSICSVKDCGSVSCPLIRKFELATSIEYPLKPLWHIHFVSHSVFIFPVIFLFNLLLPFCLLCFGYFPFIVNIISSKLSIHALRFSMMSFANKSGSGKLSRSVRLLSFIQVMSKLVLSLSIISS